MVSDHDLVECESCVCFSVRRAARTITQYYDRCLRPSGLRATQFTLLVLLARVKKLALHQVAERLGTERTTLTRNLQPLIAKRYVSVDSGEEDKRVRVISITDKGREAVAAALPHWRKAQRSITERVPATVIRSLATAARTTL